MSHLRLCAIARNEAKELPLLAEAIKDKIDSWLLVVDNRTTDDTVQVANEVFAGIPGRCVLSELTDETFRFDSARNEALELAREDGVHILLLDIDSPFVGDLPNELTEAVYWSRVTDGHTFWVMPFIVRSDVEAKYVFPAHELLRVPDDIMESPVILDDVHVFRKGAGTNPERIAWTLKVLEQEWRESKDPRAAFYIANTHRDEWFSHGLENDRQRAMDWYVKRAAIDGWAEEIYLSIYRLAELYEDLDPQKALLIYMEAAGYRPQRAEPWFKLAKVSNALGESHAALAFAEKGLALPECDDWLVVEKWVSKWGLKFEATVAADNLGQHEEALASFRTLLKRPDLTPRYRQLGEKNVASIKRQLKKRSA